MVTIPRSPGVQAGPPTITGVTAPTIAQSQILPRAIQGFGQTVSKLGFQELDRQQALAIKERDTFDATQALDFRNKLRRFDNESKIRLSELPANQETIQNEKSRILEDRQTFVEDQLPAFEGNKRLLRLVDKERSTSQVDLEFNIDKDLSRKKTQFGQNKLFESISDLKDQFETAKTDQEFTLIANDLNNTLALGLSTGLINAKDIDRQQDAFRKLRKERALELQNEQTFSDAINGLMILDSTDKNDKKLVNENYAKLALKADNPIEIAEQLSIVTGIIPAQAKKFWSSNLFNGNDSQKINSATTINDLIEANPSLDSQFSSREKALATAIESRLTLGIPESSVVKFAEEEIKTNKSAERTVRTGQFNLEFGSSETSKRAIEKVEDIIDDLEDESGFFSEAEVPEQMGLDTVRLARDFFLNEGLNMDDSLEMAKKKVKSEWYITDVGEKRYQRFAPERFYPNMTSKQIQNQVIQQVRKTTIEELPNIKNEIRLQVIPNTISADKPAYLVFTQNNLGVTEPVLGFGNIPIIFQPDVTKTEEYKKDVERREALRLTPERKEKFRTRRFRRRGFSPANTRSISTLGISQEFGA